jgi:hypothetical protein
MKIPPCFKSNIIQRTKIKNKFIVLFILLKGVNVLAADLSTLSDEFNEQSKLKSWKYFSEVEKWTNRINSIKIDN